MTCVYYYDVFQSKLHIGERKLSLFQNEKFKPKQILTKGKLLHPPLMQNQMHYWDDTNPTAP